MSVSVGHTMEPEKYGVSGLTRKPYFFGFLKFFINLNKRKCFIDKTRDFFLDFLYRYSVFLFYLTIRNDFPP